MKPILRDFPSSFQTERLLIRSPLPGDGPAVNAAVVESIDRLRPWFPWARTIPTVDESEATIREGWLAFLERRDLRLLVFSRETGALIASSGLHRIDWNVPKFEIGYWVRTPFEGKGYVTEAVNGITRFAFETLGARRVEIRCDASNTRSAAVAERCGFPLEARLKNDARDVSGALRDTLIFAQVR